MDEQNLCEILPFTEYDIVRNIKEINNERDLLKAVSTDDYEKVSGILKTGVSVDATEHNKLLCYASIYYITPLQIAAANGFDKCLQLLIDHGADVNAKDSFAVTALHMAAYFGHYCCLKILLKAKAHASVPTKFSYGAQVQPCGQELYKIVPHIEGTTPLHLAATANHVDCVKELIQHGADFNAIDEYGHTSLYVAALAGFSECVLAHLKYAMGRDILSLPSFKTSNTPLHFAVMYCMTECVNELLLLGSDVNHKNFNGLSPLHMAFSPANATLDAQMKIVQLLVLKGYNPNINQPDWEGYTPLHYVCFNGYHNMWLRRPEMAKFLISYGANVNIKKQEGVNLLEHELKNPEANFEILKYIVKSMLHLPRLKYLNFHAHSEFLDMFHSPGYSYQYQFLPPLTHLELMSYDEMKEISTVSMASNVPPTYQESILFLASQQPYWSVPIDYNYEVEFQNRMDDNSHSLLTLRKWLWYEKIASSPRTLQHHCRYTIRNALGPVKLKHVKKLPIPPLLHSYLLLETDECI